MNGNGITYIEIEPTWSFTPQEMGDIKRSLFKEISRLHESRAAASEQPARWLALSNEIDRMEGLLARLLK